MPNRFFTVAEDLLRRRTWSESRFTYLFSQIIGLVVYKLLNDFLLRDSFFTEPWYDSWITTSKQDAFLDVGANLGFYSRRLARRAGIVVAFEPNPEVYRRLTQRMKAYPNVVCYPYAVGEKVQSVRLYLFDQDAGSSIQRTSKEYVVVDCVTLDSILGNFPLNGKKIKLMKIDVEGAELQVLQGATQLITSHKPRILLEVFGNENVPPCAELLARLQYSLKVLKIYADWGQWWFVADPM